MASAPTTDPLKKSLPGGIRLVTIHVVSQVHKTLKFVIKSHLPVKVLVDKYFSVVSLQRGTVDFIYNGQRLNLQRTPDQLGMEDVDVVEVMTHVNGGGI